MSEYGQMKNEEKWRAMNRRTHTERDPVFYWGSWIIGTMAVPAVIHIVHAIIHRWF